MKWTIIGICVFLCISIVLASQSSKKIEKKSKSKNEITKQLPESNGKFSKTLYTIDQVDLIVCDHREASFTFKCTFEYAKIDLKFGLEENKRKRICSRKRKDSVKLCKSLQFLGCHPEIGLEQWCKDRKEDIEEQKKYWHMSIGQICHKNLIKHTKLCKNGRKKIKEGDKHISAEQIQAYYDKNKLRKTTIKPKPPVLHTTPSKVVSIARDDNQILIDYIFGDIQFSIKKPDLLIFIDHVFNENNKPPKSVKPSVITIQSKPVVVPQKPIKPTRKPKFVQHVLSEGIPVTGKPSITYSKAKVNSRLTELLLDYIYGVNRPNESLDDFQLFIDHLFEEKQKLIQETKLRTNLVEIILGFKPILELDKPAKLPIKPIPIKKPIKPVPIKEPIKLLTTKKPHFKYEHTKKPQIEFKPVITFDVPVKPPIKPVPIKIPISSLTTRKPYGFSKSTIKPKPVIVLKDEFDVSFIFKIADELLTPRDSSEYLNSNGESNLKHYNFLIGNENKKSNVNELEFDNNGIYRKNEKVYFVKRNKNEAINDLMRSMGAN